MSAKVADVMTRSVIAVRRNASFKELAVKLRDERISAFPVIDDDNRVIGVVSEADLIAKEATAGGYEDFTGPLVGLLHRHELEKARALTAGELMSKPPVIVRPDDTVELRRSADVRPPDKAASGRGRRGPPGWHRQPDRRTQRLQPAGRRDPASDHP